MLFEHAGRAPTIDPEAYVTETAVVIGNVALAAGASIWFGAVLRGDNDPITIGARSNIQDNCTLHADPGFPATVGEGCTVGHGAIVHGCTVEDNCLIGMGSTILNGARIGRDSIVGACALVTEGKQFPPGSLILGVPAKVARPLTPEEITGIGRSATGYFNRSRQFLGGALRKL